VSEFEITYQAREWVEFRGAMVPVAATALFPMSSDYVPSGFIEFSVGYTFPHSDAMPVLAEYKYYGDATREQFRRVDPYEIIDVILATWIDDPKYRAAPKKLDVEFSSRDLAGRAKDAVRKLELEEVARIYLLSPTRGTSNVMEQLGYGSKATAIRRVMDARKAGLIPPPESSAAEFAAALEKLQGEG
jgi:hypothetical protein